MTSLSDFFTGSGETGFGDEPVYAAGTRSVAYEICLRLDDDAEFQRRAQRLKDTCDEMDHLSRLLETKWASFPENKLTAWEDDLEEIGQLADRALDNVKARYHEIRKEVRKGR